MGLTKTNIGDLIEQTYETNSELSFREDDVRGMTITKQIIPTKANMSEMDLKKFIVVLPNDFIYNPRTHGQKIGLGFNDSNETFIISWNNTAFRLKKEVKEIVLPKYLFLHFNRLEWDREACFRSWGSSTEVFSWDALCEMQLDLPPLPVQQKYVDVYNAMVKNQQAYEKGLEDLKLTCDATIEDLRRKLPIENIGQYIIKKNIKNANNKIKDVKGISTNKDFRIPKSTVNINELSNYKIVEPGEIAFVQTTNNEKVFAFAFNNLGKTVVVSSVDEVFSVDKNKLLPEYLTMWFKRSEFDRYVRFHSWGSARETFTWDDLCEVKIPIPSIKTQQSIVDIYNVYIKRKQINEILKHKIKEICPILIRGAVEEGKKYKKSRY